MSSIVNAVGSFFGHDSQARNAQKSVSDYQNAVQWSNAASKDAFNNQLTTYQPFYQTGVNGLNSMASMQTSGYQYSPSDPSYAWRFGQGMNGLNNELSAAGLLQSGGGEKAAMRYGQGLASTEFQNDFNRNNQLAGYGQEAARGIATANQNYANNQQNAFFKGADGMAGGRTAQGNATAAQWGDGTNFVNAVGSAASGGSFGSTAATVAGFFGF